MSNLNSRRPVNPIRGFQPGKSFTLVSFYLNQQKLCTPLAFISNQSLTKDTPVKFLRTNLNKTLCGTSPFRKIVKGRMFIVNIGCKQACPFVTLLTSSLGNLKEQIQTTSYLFSLNQNNSNASGRVWTRPKSFIHLTVEKSTARELSTRHKKNLTPPTFHVSISHVAFISTWKGESVELK